jgi:xanthine dehydrogenase small subunit
MLHGKQLITVENLKSSSSDLHPVQQAMVDSHGSQCGFCTPGFVMSMFALTKNSSNATRGQIDEALTGNLCRCTGYRPIIEAAAIACATKSGDHFSNLQPETIKTLQSITTNSLHLRTQRQDYFRPTSLTEALELKRLHPAATVVNGATDIALRVTKQHELIEKILDLSGIAELKLVEHSTSELRLGAGCSLETVKESTQSDFPALHSMLSVFGSLQIRNLATLGGNLGTASPIGDTLPVLIAYNARVVLQSVEGRREIAMDDFFTGYRKTARKPDELIVAIILPKLNNDTIVKAYKVSKRRDLDIATVSGAFCLKKTESGEVERLKLAFGGMAERTKCANKTESFLRGKRWNRETVEQAMEILYEEFTPIADVRSGNEFRKLAARNLLMKFFVETTAPG